ncbi:MAG TPA: ATP-binding protein, partial [Steroidobacteraceae bacterium]
MQEKTVRRLLFLAIFVVAILPLGAALYFLDETLRTSLDLGFNDSIVRALDTNIRDLKALKNLDPDNTARYRSEFEAVERLRHVYHRPELLKERLLQSLRIYFAAGMIAAMLASLLLAAMLGRRITRAYKATFDELIRQRERTRYLEEMGSWQELARMLAHEIKNPLTPIEVLVSSLSRSYLSKSELEFREQLRLTQTMIAEELDHLKNTVNKFSEFARLPVAQMTVQRLPPLLEQLAKALAASLELAQIEISLPTDPADLCARVDATLMRQVLNNILRNGIEANPGRRVRFAIGLLANPDWIEISIANDGRLVPADIAGRIFDPYVSAGSGKDNMGLGLAIVKKIAIEHGGEISYQEREGQAVFVLRLPRAR